MLNVDFGTVADYCVRIKKVLYDPLFMAVVAAGLATWTGARAAEKTGIKNARREAALAEIKHINHAIMVAYSIANTMLVFKKQIILKLVNDYVGGRNKFFQDVAKSKSSNVNEDNRVVSVSSNLIYIDAPLLPLDSLDSLIFEKISSGSRCLAATIQLREYYNYLTSAIHIRRNVIENKSGKLTSHIYYGYPHQNTVDNRYHDSIFAIKSYVDHLIFFSTVICEDLVVNGNSVAKKFKEEHGDGAPLIDRVNFEMAYSEGLVPFSSEYKSWLSSFGKHPKRPCLVYQFYLKAILILGFVLPFFNLWLVIDMALLLLMCVLLGLAILL